MKKEIRILVVEDSENDALLIINQVKKGDYDVYYERVDNALDMNNALKAKKWDIILSDYAMPHFSGLKALELLKESGIDISFIIISGTIGEEVAVEAMKKGADDYMMKDNLKRLLPAIERELRVAKSRANQKLSEQKKKQAEESLRESEERYRLIAENTADTIVVMDLEFNMTYVSPSVQKLRGYTVQEAMSQTLNQILTPKSLQKVKKVFAEQLELDASKTADPNRSVLLELEEFHKNGSIIQVEISVSFIHDDKLNPIRLLAVSRDITKRKQAEEKLKVLSHAVEQNPIMIVITDTKGNIEYANPKFEKVTGYSMTEVIGKNPRIIKSGKMSEKIYEDMWDTIKANNVWQGELINKKKNGELFWSNLSVSPITDAEGNVTHFVGIQEDISERKKIEEELIFAKEKAEESDRLKSAFLANMSHEIRTPMNGILGFAELLKNPELTGDEQNEYIKIIEKAGARMLNIINDIISISRIESGQVEVFSKETIINGLIEQVFYLLKPDADNKHIKFSCSNGLPANESIVKTDSQKLYSILTNLVKNAIKYTDIGSVEFGYNKKGDYLEFYVKDTGIGIPKNRQKAIFERFIQADIEDKMARQGAGLGLSISSAYADMLGSKIWLQSEEGLGSTFYFKLPYNYIPKENNEIKNNYLKVEKSSMINPEISGLKILIAENDETSGKLISMEINKLSREIILVTTGSDAIEACRRNPDIDLILMDIQMPDLNGYEATRQIRQFNKNIVIIAQTAFALTGDREKAINAGCNDYIAKPIKKEELRKLINKYFKS